jgi:hypothetical protein
VHDSTNREKGGRAYVLQPFMGPQNRKGRLAEAEEQEGPDDELPLPRGKLTTLLSAVEEIRHRGH